MSPRRFCMVTTFYPPHHFGGDAMYAYRLTQALAERGHRVDVLHSHIPQQVPREDMNTVFPLWRLQELQSEGVVGEVAATHYSMLGYNTRAADVAEHLAPAIAALMKAEGVDLALIVPV